MDCFLKTAEEIIRKAGLLAKEMQPKLHILKRKEHGDIVTEGDLSVQTHVMSSLKKAFPDHGFISEELGEPENPDAEYIWILDPIDGTKYYIRNVPLYTISLALRRRGETILGLVYSPDLDRMYCARKDNGATENGRIIRCSTVPRLAEASICLEIPSRDSGEAALEQATENMFKLVRQAYRVRILGVSALGLCLCAAGGFDAYVNLGSPSKDYDVAAGEIILREAGGEVCEDRGEGSKLIAGPRTLCEQIKNLLQA